MSRAFRPLWSAEELDLIDRHNAGEFDRAELFGKLPNRSRSSISRLIFSRAGNYRAMSDDIHEPRALDPADEGYEDGELTRRRIAAAASSAALLERIRATLSQAA